MANDGIRARVALFIFLIVFFPATLRAELSEVQVVQIEVAGHKTEESVEVKMLLPDSRDPEKRPIKAKDYLTLGVELIIPARTVVDIGSPSGTSVSLSPGSRFRVNSTSRSGEMYALSGGKASFRVGKVLDFFNVEFEGFAALVRGTKFKLGVEPGRQISAELTEGRLRVERNAKVKIEEGARTADVSEVKVLDPRKVKSITYSLRQDEFLHQFGTFRDAEGYYREQLGAAMRGGDFDLIQAARNDLGSILVTMGKPETAEPIFQQGAVEAESRNDKPWLARMLNNLGAAELSVRDYRHAIDTLEQALAVNLELYPDGVQKRIAHNYNNLGLAYRGLGDIRKAIEYFEKALKTNLLLSADGKSRAIAGNYGNLGNAYLLQGDEPRGFEYLERAIGMLQDLYPDGKHQDLGSAYNDLGVAFFRAGNYAKAMHYHYLALRVRTGLFPDQDHPSLAESYSNYGLSLCKMGIWRLGLELQEKALAMEQRLYPSGVHRSIAASYRRLAEAWRDRGDAAKSAEYDRRAEEVEARLRESQ